MPGLSFLMNPVNHQVHSKEFRGMERFYYARCCLRNATSARERRRECCMRKSGSTHHDPAGSDLRDRNFSSIPLPSSAPFNCHRTGLSASDLQPGFGHRRRALVLAALVLVIAGPIGFAHSRRRTGPLDPHCSRPYLRTACARGAGREK